jgi:hypothetical protein
MLTHANHTQPSRDSLCSFPARGLAAEMLTVEVKTKGEDCRCAIQGFQEEGAVQVFCRQTTPVCASASKAKSSVLSQLSGLENVLFNDFIDDELDSEDVSEKRTSAPLPDSVPIKSEEERAAREEDEMAALDAVGDYGADATVMLEDVPQDMVFKTLKVSCACVAVLVFACVCVCVCACARRRYVFVRIVFAFLDFVCVCACNGEVT